MLLLCTCCCWIVLSTVFGQRTSAPVLVPRLLRSSLPTPLWRRTASSSSRSVRTFGPTMAFTYPCINICTGFEIKNYTAIVSLPGHANYTCEELQVQATSGTLDSAYCNDNTSVNVTAICQCGPFPSPPSPTTISPAPTFIANGNQGFPLGYCPLACPQNLTVLRPNLTISFAGSVEQCQYFTYFQADSFNDPHACRGLQKWYRKQCGCPPPQPTSSPSMTPTGSLSIPPFLGTTTTTTYPSCYICGNSSLRVAITNQSSPRAQLFGQKPPVGCLEMEYLGVHGALAPDKCAIANSSGCHCVPGSPLTVATPVLMSSPSPTQHHPAPLVPFVILTKPITTASPLQQPSLSVSKAVRQHQQPPPHFSMMMLCWIIFFSTAPITR